MQRSSVVFGIGVVALILGVVILALGGLILFGSFMDMDPPYDEPVFWPLLVGCAVTAVGVAGLWFGDRRPPSRPE